MNELTKIAAANQQRAREVIRDSGSKPHGAPSAPNPTWSGRSARDC